MIYIWVRETTDWQNERTFLAQVDPKFRPKVELWNDTFDMPFHVFRHKLREIAKLNLSKVENAVCAAWDEIPDGSLVIPVDDEDWFAPHVATVLDKERDPAASGYYWITSHVEVPISLGHWLYLIRRRLLPFTPPKWICTTNNYAAIKGPENRDVLATHTRASEWFKRPEPARVKWIERHLSIANRTLASKTSLCGGRLPVRRSELLHKFRKYKALYHRPPAPELVWSRPYLAMMSELMGELNLREVDR